MNLRSESSSPGLLLHGNSFKSPSISEDASSSPIISPSQPLVRPPPSREGNAIKAREQLILEKRRETRRREEDEAMGRRTPPRTLEKEGTTTYGGRSTRRRSMSTGDAEMSPRRPQQLEAPSPSDLQASIEQELKRTRAGKNVRTSPSCALSI